MTIIARSIFRFFVSIILLLVTGSLFYSIIHLRIQITHTSPLLSLIIGFASGMIIFSIFHKFLTLYVFGHEFTHWLTAKTFFRRTTKFSVTSKGGSVSVDNPNIWIILSPYFIPIYTLIIVGIYGLYIFIDHSPKPYIIFTFNILIGFSYAFHIILTAYALSKGQNDLKEHGFILSITLILFMNTLILFFALIICLHQLNTGIKYLGIATKWEWKTLWQFIYQIKNLLN